MAQIFRSLVLLLLVLAATACAAAGPRPKERIYATYPALEIRWLGNYDLVYADDGYIGLERALAIVEGHGIAPQRLEAASIEGVMSRGLQMLPTEVDGRPIFFDISLRIAGCENRVYFRTTFTGRVVGQRDPSGCLATG